MRTFALAAVAALTLLTPAYAADDSFVLASIWEDEFFEVPDLTLDNAADIIVPTMPKAACTQAARLLTNYGAMVACVPRPENMTDDCLYSQVKPTDSNLEACYGPAMLAGVRDEALR